jgi:hypothetical protein
MKKIENFVGEELLETEYESYLEDLTGAYNSATVRSLISAYLNAQKNH